MISLRSGFSEHAFYTYYYVASYPSEESKFVLKRLFRTATDIGNKVSESIGKKNAEKLSSILKEHIEITGKAVEAVYKQESPPGQDIVKNTVKLGDFIEELGHDSNTIKREFYHHTMFVLYITKARMHKNWENTLNLFDDYYQHMLMFSDLLSESLI